MTSYFKIALKVLRRRKFFTFVSLFGTSLTLVVLMVAAAILDNFFAPRAPESRFNRVLTVIRVTQWGRDNIESTDPGYAFVQQYVKTLPSAERTSAFSSPQTVTVYKGAERIEASMKRTDADYWQILDFHFVEGRPFTAQEDGNGALVAVITESLRDKLFGPGPAAGKTFTVADQRFTVIGIVPDVSITRLAAYAEMWAPIGSFPSSGFRHELMGGFNGLVLAHSRADFPKLRREFAGGLRTFPLDRKMYSELRTGLDTQFEAFARLLTHNRAGDNASMIVVTVLAIVAVLFMTLPALNLVTLNLSRILERASEIGVRKAFGAPRRALVLQFVVENVVLTVIGGVIGFVLSVIVLARITASDLIPNAHFDVNARVFVYGMLIAVVFGLFSGVYPAWRMSRLDPVNALRGGAA